MYDLSIVPNNLEVDLNAEPNRSQPSKLIYVFFLSFAHFNSLHVHPDAVQASHVKTDSAVFRLHTNATVILLVTFSIAVTTRQYVGNPIDCVHTR